MPEGTKMETTIEELGALKQTQKWRKNTYILMIERTKFSISSIQEERIFRCMTENVATEKSYDKLGVIFDKDMVNESHIVNCPSCNCPSWISYIQFYTILS